jgi:hypothetical protein
MSDELGNRIENVNARLAVALRQMQASLRGESAFTGEDVKGLQVLLSEMEPIIARSAELRRVRPDLAASIDAYKEHLLEIQKTVEKIRVTLIVQKNSLDASRAQVNATSQWCSTFNQIHT